MTTSFQCYALHSMLCIAHLTAFESGCYWSFINFPFSDQSFLHENVSCSDKNIINKHLLGLEKDVGYSDVG